MEKPVLNQEELDALLGEENGGKPSGNTGSHSILSADDDTFPFYSPGDSARHMNVEYPVLHSLHGIVTANLRERLGERVETGNYDAVVGPLQLVQGDKWVEESRRKMYWKKSSWNGKTLLFGVDRLFVAAFSESVFGSGETPVESDNLSRPRTVMEKSIAASWIGNLGKCWLDGWKETGILLCDSMNDIADAEWLRWFIPEEIWLEMRMSIKCSEKPAGYFKVVFPWRLIADKKAWLNGMGEANEGSQVKPKKMETIIIPSHLSGLSIDVSGEMTGLIDPGKFSLLQPGDVVPLQDGMVDIMVEGTLFGRGKGVEKGGLRSIQVGFWLNR